ncbi:MAG: hypothetical protein M3O32_01215, partial [Actinomycetota bacterium]|nr:hypothetical protein [Actinomycetota bacterium]
MSQFSYPALEHLEARNQVVEAIIKDTAVKHAALDAVIDGVAGASPIPGTVGVALAGQLFMQVKTIYPHMIKKIALAYAAQPDAYTKKQAQKATVQEGVIAALIFASENGALEEVGSQLKEELAAQFGAQFLQQMIKDALGESLAGLGLAQVPWVGAPTGAAVAGALAWRLTWRVGLV